MKIIRLILLCFCFILFIIDILLLIVTMGNYNIDKGLLSKAEKKLKENNEKYEKRKELERLQNLN